MDTVLSLFKNASAMNFSRLQFITARKFAVAIAISTPQFFSTACYSEALQLSTEGR